ncbi:hypothetical protein [Methylobacterium isbiliense]|jgi:hypothetical protein|uniref:Uncharacterized protein n=1 Tax=Methylobacterium isbiliense TaxID=315478 RepID=A0ABQ4SET5_9HYPH|nr:hypothetical protein [Methylobacterium isbiliense]MDN3621451.1 hypothetical protein [Methylobacterium isbiliense]GJE00913.1 hypothetical protein GMJLKIPL_2840 [Methylobacterium isbiliense]
MPYQYSDTARPDQAESEDWLEELADLTLPPREVTELSTAKVQEIRALFERGEERHYGSRHPADLAVAEAKKQRRAEAQRARKRQDKQNQRARERDVRSKEAAAALVGLDVRPVIQGHVDHERLERETAALVAWLATTGREQGALKGKNGASLDDLMASRRVHLAAQAIGNPGYGEFARLLAEETGRPWSKDQARRRLAMLNMLEEPGKPWAGGGGDIGGAGL